MESVALLARLDKKPNSETKQIKAAVKILRGKLIIVNPSSEEFDQIKVMATAYCNRVYSPQNSEGRLRPSLTRPRRSCCCCKHCPGNQRTGRGKVYRPCRNLQR